MRFPFWLWFKRPDEAGPPQDPDRPRGYAHIEHKNRPSFRAPAFLIWVQLVAERNRELKPWTLVELPGEPWPIVANSRNLLWRLITAWHNAWRRPKRRKMLAAIAHHFSPGQITARNLGNRKP